MAATARATGYVLDAYGRPVRSSLRVRNQALYEAGSHARRTAGWRAPTTSANEAILGNMRTLRDRSRAATRNDGTARGVIEKLVSSMIGTGIKPLSAAPDAAFKVALHALWLRWTKVADADGLLDFYGMQALAVRSWLEAGECFGRLRDRLPADGLPVPLQVQLLEPELCPHDYNAYSPDLRIRAGIQFSPIGARTTYWFHPSRPELDDYDAARLVPVPADHVAHLFEPLRPGQLRGIPHLTQALIKLYELDKYDDATLIRQQLAAMFAAFIKSPGGVGDLGSFNPVTGMAAETADGKPTITLQPGIVQELGPGEEMQFSEPPAADGYADFMRQQLYGVSAATGVPYELLTGDMRGVNDRTVRVILNEFRGRIQAWQYGIVAVRFCEPIWRAWMWRVWLSGALSFPASFATDPEPWLAVKWTPPRVPYIQPVQDIQAQKDAIRSGLTSRAATVAEYGEDAEQIDREQADDNARADQLGLVYDTDPRKASNAGLTQARAAGSGYVDPAGAEGDGQGVTP